MKRRSLLILSVIALLFASCGNKGGESGLMVPKDAAVVLHINSSSLSSKLSWEEIRQTNWFKTMHKEAAADDTLANQLLANPASSGIDTKAGIVFYIKKHSNHSYMIFAGSLTDAGAFEKLCKGMHSGAEVKKEGDFSYMNVKEHGAVVWNNFHFAFAGNAPLPDMGSMMKEGRRSYSGDGARRGFLPDSLRILGIEALTLKNSDNLDKDDRFLSLIKDSNDVHVWLNTGQLYSGIGTMLPMLQVNELFEDNVSAISLNFDNGRISAKSKTWYGDKMSKLMASHKAEPVSAEVINRISSSNVVGVMAFNYSPAGIKDLLKMIGVDALADMFLAKADFSIDDFIKANKGEVLFAFSDPGSINKQDTIRDKKGNMTITHHSGMDMKVLFATAVNDKAAFEKLVTMIGGLSEKFGKGDIMKGMPGINYKLENNWFAASNSPEFTDKFLAGGNSKLPFTDKITGHPVGIYIDLQKVMGLMHSAFGSRDTSNKTGLGNAPNMWEDIVIKGGDYKNKATEFEVEVNLVDKNTNSLKQMNQYLDKMLSLKKERKKLDIREVRIEDIKQEKDKPEPPPPPPPAAKKKAKK